MNKPMKNKTPKPAPKPTGAASHWKRMRFKNNKVWIATDESGKLLVENGKHLMKYQLNQTYTYWVRTGHVKSLDTPEGKPLKQKTKKTEKKAGTATGIQQTEARNTQQDQTAIDIYTDGASSGNPGPAGIGVFLRYGEHEKKISRYIGNATNNIAELEAIRTGLSEINNPNLPVSVYTDSNYAFGLLTQNWKAKKNKALVNEIRKLVSKFKHVRFVKVKGHAGDEGNEIADKLATSAIKKSGA
jgi:ribonuclease HI